MSLPELRCVVEYLDGEVLTGTSYGVPSVFCAFSCAVRLRRARRDWTALRIRVETLDGGIVWQWCCVEARFTHTVNAECAERDGAVLTVRP